MRLVNAAPYRELIGAGRPVIFIFWHGEMLPLMFQHIGQRIVLLVSEHRDGEIIARIGASFGYEAIRGSTSRGAGRALLGVIRVLQSGASVAVTPDGPRGPAHTVAPGALVAAQRAGVPIVPAVAHTTRGWRLRSWDRFLIPKPFARITVVYGDPTFVSGETARDAAADTERFQRLLEEAARVAHG